MKTIFKSFLKESQTLPHWPKTKEEAQKIVDQLCVNQETGEVFINPNKVQINDDLTITVNGDATFLPWHKWNGMFPIKFKEVNGSFFIIVDDIRQNHIPLTSLLGCPDRCDSFSIGEGVLHQSVKNLVGSPKRTLNVSINGNITSLEGFPEVSQSPAIIIDLWIREVKDFSHLPKTAGKISLYAPHFSESDFKFLPPEFEHLNIRESRLKTLHNFSDHVKKLKYLDIGYADIESHILSLFKIQGLEEVSFMNYENEDWVEIVNKTLRDGGDIFDCQEALIEAGLEEYAQL